MSKVESLIKAQLSDDLVEQFDVVYVKNNNIVSLRSNRDLMGSVQNDNVFLWCDGLKRSQRKRTHVNIKPGHQILTGQTLMVLENITKKTEMTKYSIILMQPYMG